MSIIHCYASDAPDLYRLAVQMAQLVNAHLFWDLRQMDDLERRARLGELRQEFEDAAGI